MTGRQAAAAVRSELLGPEASWHRTSLEPPEEPKLAAERRRPAPGAGGAGGRLSIWCSSLSMCSGCQGV